MASKEMVAVGIKKWSSLGRGGGQVVSVLVFHSDDPSSNPADAYIFFCKIWIWKERE